jgi:serine/threonine protein kinase
VLRVAVVDDSDLMRNLVKRVLVRRGHEVTTHEDGKAALEDFMKGPLPDVVVSDLMMPRLTGDELCAKLTAKLGTSGPPVIILSTADDEESIGRALMAGCVHYVKKPFDAAHLVALVENAPRSARGAPKKLDASLDRLGPYKIKAMLGKGGMGIVYRAVREDRPGIEVALKVGCESSLGRDTERFLRELDLLGSLDHPGLARLVDTGAADGHIYYAMELVAGVSIDEELSITGAMDWLRVARVGRDVAACLAYCHSREVVHRDVKPGNVLLSKDGPTKLIDFGLARRPHDPTLTDRSEIVGTAHYLAPELLEDGTFTPASDAFALGITLYEALLGRHPVTDRVDGNVAYELHATFSKRQVAPVRTVVPDCPEDLALVITSLIEPRPTNRPSCNDAASALSALVASS